MPTHLSKTQLVVIPSTHDGQTRNPANLDKALAALGPGPLPSIPSEDLAAGRVAADDAIDRSRRNLPAR